MSITTPSIETVLQDSKPRPPRKCHDIDHRGYAVCGAFGPKTNPDGSRNTSGLHSHEECRARGHRHCVVCEELTRQLGDDGMVA